MKKPFFLFLFAPVGLVCAADLDVQNALNDALRRFPPGDYQNFIPQIISPRLHPSTKYRLDLLDAMPPSRLSPEEFAEHQKRLVQRLEQFRTIRIFANPLSLSAEIQRLTPTIPELPTKNPFEGPIRLFDIQ